jgi:hypothetical protein
MNATTAENAQPRNAAGFGWGLVLVLAALLAAQIALALFLGQRGTGPGPAGRDTPLMAFEPAKVERIRIERRGSDPFVLERVDKGWQVQSLSGFPAAGARIDTLLERLAGLKRGLPVATSQDALARLKVAESDYEERLTIESGGKAVADLFLGDTAGARRRYLRTAGETAVLEAELSPTDVPTKAEDWTDRALLNLDERDIQRIELPGITLEKAEGGWRLADPKDGETLDQSKVADLARRLGSLTFVSVLGTEDKPEYGQDAPVLEWRIGLASGDTPSYRLSRLKTDAEPAPAARDGATEAPKPKGPEWYVLKVSDRPHYLKVASYTAEGLLSAKREGLLAQPDIAPTVALPADADGTSTAVEATTPPNPPTVEPAEPPPTAPAPAPAAGTE